MGVALCTIYDMTAKSQKQSDRIGEEIWGEYTGKGATILLFKIGEKTGGHNIADNRPQLRIIETDDGNYVLEYNSYTIVHHIITKDKPKLGEIYDSVYDDIDFNVKQKNMSISEAIKMKTNLEYDNIVEKFEEIYN
jgi:hypothetical protein